VEAVPSEPREKYHLVLVPSWSCNLRCKGCAYAGMGYKGPVLTPQDLKKIAEYPFYKVNIMGGEPLVYPHLREAFDIFSDRKITLQTNATLFVGARGKELVKLAKRARLVICSIEGDAKTTDFIRGEGVWGKVMAAVKSLKEEGVDVFLRATYRGIGQVEYLIRLHERMKIPVYLYPEIGGYVPTRREQLALFNTLSQQEEVWLDLPSYWSMTGRPSYCSAGKSRLAIFPDGTVAPCQWMPEYRVGRVGEDWDFIREGLRTFDNTKVVPTSCAGCRYAKTCRGGCLVAPWFSTCPFSSDSQGWLWEGNLQFKWNVREAKARLSGVVLC
jgi:radical SAM protein with 4Fe4S-binding SPASM domain